uniref:Uncharacterized protein n=1 Tax=Utricularia reniformis TaxID=192314 RepID=A0A1Y0B398_9LAMI|nr:hypothetical protein AEK19_MT1739 [Utricularia reniformis]ART31916.1 hypothetical protein AEK19_MT1739 [Utricularia reniformis]
MDEHLDRLTASVIEKLLNSPSCERPRTYIQACFPGSPSPTDYSSRCSDAHSAILEIGRKNGLEKIPSFPRVTRWEMNNTGLPGSAPSCHRHHRENPDSRPKAGLRGGPL